MFAAVSALTLAVAANALPAGNAAPQIPIYYEYGGYPRIQTNITWGTPAQAPIPAIFDTGSVAFWTYGPNAIINDGSHFLATPGPCNKTVEKTFNWPNSSTHSPVMNLTQVNIYSYGGNGKLISAYQDINDTMSFGSGSTPIPNTQVALSNYTIVRQGDDGCKIDVNTFDQSILGVGPFGVGGAQASSVGPSLRTNLRSQGKISSDTLSMWMNKAPKDVKGTYRGTALFGQPLPSNAYSGKLVSVKVSPPTDQYVGYYSALPSIAINGAELGLADTSVTNCLIDSGTGQDQLPFKMADAAAHSRIFEYTSPEGFVFSAWNGSCESIPASATFDVTFPGAKTGEDAVVKIPIRSYARGTNDALGNVPQNVCGLTFTLDNFGGCTFGAPFFTAAALQFDDDEKTISIAQGGVA